MDLRLKKDRYRRARGGYSRLLEINCSSCDTKLLDYQKDGPGIIKRLYVDRIFSDINTPNINCKNCGQLIGKLTIYEKEKRKAYNIVPGSIKKKIIRLK